MHWSDDAYLRFEAPRVTPIYIGALGPNMLRLAGEVADGVLPLLFPPEHYYDVLPFLQEGIARRSSDLGQLDFAACIWASPGRGRRRSPPCPRRESPCDEATPQTR